MADNTQITPGSGEVIRDIDRAGVKTQVVQVDVGGASAELLLVGDAVLGIPVNIKGFPAGAVVVNNPTAANLKVDASGVAVPITDNSGSLTVDAAKTAPVSVRLSDGTNNVDTIPISGNATAAQGAPNVTLASAWPTKVTDGTTSVTVMGAELLASPSAPADGHAGALRMTATRGLHANLRDVSGVELGTSGNPVRNDPTGGTVQPVSGTVTAKIQDSSGTAYSATNPLYMTRGGRARTRVTKSVAITASQTASVIWTPTSGKAFYIEVLVLVLSVGGALTLFDGTNAAANLVFDGTWPVAAIPLVFSEPWASSAVNNVLKYTTGSSVTGVLTVNGFEV